MIAKKSTVLPKGSGKITIIPRNNCGISRDNYNGLTNLDTKYVKMRWKN